MKVILCLDDNNGMMFHQRRQSRDRVVIEDIRRISEGNRLFMTEYSLKLFQDEKDKILVEKNCLAIAGEDDYCFIENQSLKPFENRISQLILYRWNRKYPADVYLDLTLEEWSLESREEMKGFSHEKITKEIYSKMK